MTEASNSSLQTIVDEFKDISPDITETAIFTGNGDILARTKNVTSEDIKKLVITFEELENTSKSIGCLSALSIQGASSRLNIVSMNKRYSATVSSRNADEKVVKALTRVIIPTVINLIDQADNDSTVIPQISPVEKESIEPKVVAHKETVQNESATALLLPPTEPILPQPTGNQFMVEKIGGILNPSDIVRVDSELIATWNDLYSGKKITEIHIQTLEGRTATSKFRPIRQKYQETKGIIQIPEKILETLQISDGKLVVVKPIVP